MPSHIHLIFRSSNDDPSGLIRDFKCFTSKEVMKLDNDVISRINMMFFRFKISH